MAKAAQTRHIMAGTRTGKKAGRQTARHADIQPGIQPGIPKHTGTQACSLEGKQAHIQKCTQTYTHTARQADRHTHTCIQATKQAGIQWNKHMQT